MLFNLSLSDSKSPQVSRTLLSIMTDLSNNVVRWIFFCDRTKSIFLRCHFHNNYDTTYMSVLNLFLLFSHTRVHTHARMHVRARTRKHTHTHTHTHIYIYIYIYRTINMKRMRLEVHFLSENKHIYLCVAIHRHICTYLQWNVRFSFKFSSHAFLKMLQKYIRSRIKILKRWIV